MNCDICAEIYDTSTHLPLCLPCGHNFCQICIKTLIIQETKLCPKCRADFIIPLEELQVNQALLDQLTNDCESSIGKPTPSKASILEDKWRGITRDPFEICKSITHDLEGAIELFSKSAVDITEEMEVLKSKIACDEKQLTFLTRGKEMLMQQSRVLDRKEKQLIENQKAFNATTSFARAGAVLDQAECLREDILTFSKGIQDILPRFLNQCNEISQESDHCKASIKSLKEVQGHNEGQSNRLADTLRSMKDLVKNKDGRDGESVQRRSNIEANDTPKTVKADSKESINVSITPFITKTRFIVAIVAIFIIWILGKQK